MVFTELPKSYLQNQIAREMRQAFIFWKETFGRKRAHRVPSAHAREVAAQAE